MYHRWTGLAAVVHATIHFTEVTKPWLLTPAVQYTFRNTRIRLGIMAWCALCIVAITPVNLMRRKAFEVFYYMHFSFIAFVIGALIHASHGPEYLLPGFLLWGIDRLIRFRCNFRKAEITSINQYIGEVTKLQIGGMRSPRPGQTVWIQFWRASFLDWHPFSVASASELSEITVAVRNSGGYTGKLHVIAQGFNTSNADTGESNELSSFKVRVDGPYGVGRIPWGSLPITVLVAGGIGITPGLSIASSIIKKAAPATGSSRETKRWHIHLIWVIKNHDHVEWFAEELRSLEEAASASNKRATMDISIFVTGNLDVITGNEPITDRPKSSTERGKTRSSVFTGRPDMRQILQNILQNHHGLDGGVNVCGPRSLIWDVRRAAASTSSRSGVLYVEEEVFEI